MNPIVFAVPLYALLIGIEFLICRGRRPEAYRLTEVAANVSAGLGQITTDIFLGLLYIVPYGALLVATPLPRLPADALWVWAVAFVGVDLAFYWQHRLSHRVNILWAAHVVHHQAEHYNLSVALRQPWFSVLSNWVYYLPLAILGVPVEVFLGCTALNLLYQFYLHTPLIGSMGGLGLGLGRVLNTPSHHRVHQGWNPRYLDCNYPGVFILWDRIFGTFVSEDPAEDVEFGSSRRYTSTDGVFANFDHLQQLSRGVETRVGRVRLWLAPPERVPAGASARPAPQAQPTTRIARVYAVFWMSVSIFAATGLLGWVGLVLWTLWTAGGFLDGRRWARPAELVRLAALAMGCAFVVGGM